MGLGMKTFDIVYCRKLRINRTNTEREWTLFWRRKTVKAIKRLCVWNGIERRCREG